MSSSSSVTSTTVSGTTRVTGLVSGIDVDSIVEQLMSAKKTKLNKLQQQQQLAEWRQETYRGIISEVQSFTSKYFDVTSSSSLLSQSTFRQFQTSSSSAVTVTAGSGAAAGTHSIQVSQLATAATRTTDGRLSQDIRGASAADYSSLTGKSFVIEVDGSKKTVTLDDSVADAASLQTAIDKAVGEGKVTVTEDAGVLTIAAASGSGVQKITVSSSGSSSSALESLGFSGEGAILSNRIDTSATLETLAGTIANSFTFNSDDQVEFAVNGVSFTFDKDDTLDQVMKKINQSDAGVTLSYNSLSDQLVLTAGETGAGQTLTVTETDSTFLAAALSQASAGQDAKLTLDGQELTRSSNTVTVDGVIYTLNETTTEAVTVTLAQDTDTIYDTIAGFVNDYNALIDSINAELSAEYDSDYPPLTEDQKAEMSEDEIEEWEAKAKTGLLAGDSVLKNLLSNLRTAVYDSVAGQSVTISGIGITTGTYDEKGKLHIDETKLKEAIEANPEGVMNLFTQQSSAYSGTTTVRTLNSGELQTRYKEEGLAYRFYDILQANVSTIRDNSGNKGLLLQKAGTSGDASSTDNVLTNAINDYQERIEKEEERLDEEEERLYAQYTSLETYISQMNAQLTALQSYLNTGS
ncbi:flagellar filament capping protein FliD [Acetonema longum]|uniref:Flagellar hook-associated protein 2 n=1 Tax=Acetonema longum DSM 6540 TaxID=1009370 RepID=F7NH05_9FIRM|nr:flagellar filament capping protein FliD [Acetonema longum]EGO64736.1 flagellar hook-associated protein 2 [Acetonema longum DSM 6540]